MAIVDVRELWAPRSGKITQAFENEFARTWLVETDDKYDDAMMVLQGWYAATGIKVGSKFAAGPPGNPTRSTSPFSLAQSIGAECFADDGKGWRVTVPYGAWFEKVENPLDQPIEISNEFAQFERVADFDVNGDPIVNSAGDPFDPPVMVDDSRPLLKIVRNEATFDPDLANSYKDAINDFDWTVGNVQIGISTFAQYTAKCAQIASRRAFSSVCGFYHITTYEFHMNPDTWLRRVLNVGFRELVSGSKQLIKIKGIPVQSPMPLDDSGRVMAAGSPAIYREFHVLKEKDFSAFNF